MDTSPTTEGIAIGPRALMTHVERVWEQEHETDPGRATETIVGRMMKNGASAKEIICDHLGIGTFNPDVVLRAIVEQEYARSLSAEDRLVFGAAGLTPLTAQCLIALTDCATMADEAGQELSEALVVEDFSALCRQVREATGLTDADEAAKHMLVRMPALAEMMYGIPMTPDIVSHPLPLPDTCEHRARTHVLTALAYHYEECLEQREGGEPASTVGDGA